MSIIKDFYEGGLRPSEVNFKNRKYSLAFAQNENLVEKLRKTADPKQLKLLDAIIKRYTVMEMEYGKEMFAVGFSAGTKLTAEAFCTDTSTFP
ncbi:MAG: hypothetical protein IJ385_03700 [Ruminiclostridium sp.]|nr:hypothetical protein [Ruminiclostridium sp.]